MGWNDLVLSSFDLGVLYIYIYIYMLPFLFFFGKEYYMLFPFDNPIVHALILMFD